MKKNQKGFGVVEVIILLVVVGILGFGGWYMWQRNSDESSDKNNTSTQQADTSEKDQPADPTKGWKTYSNDAGDYSFKYPASWVMATNLESCSEGTILFAPSTESLGKCASENGGQMTVQSGNGDMREDFAENSLSQPYYKDLTMSEVTVAGVAGTKSTTTVSGMEDQVFVGAYPDNTKIVRYVFFTKNRTYAATYIQEPTYPDALKDFDLLVTKTLKFEE